MRSDLAALRPRFDYAAAGAARAASTQASTASHSDLREEVGTDLALHLPIS